MTVADYLTRPLRSEAQAMLEHRVLADRAELYERMLGYDEARAAYVARCSWDQRRGHYHGYLDEQPSWAPLPTAQAEIAAHTLHPDASAEFWTIAADALADWSVICSDLIDSAPTDADRMLAEHDYRSIIARIKRAREFAGVLREEQARRGCG